MLSKKAKYALQALTLLTKKYGHGPVLISDLAEKERIPKKFLELILLNLPYLEQLKNENIGKSMGSLFH